jgi:hypothetical protein
VADFNADQKPDVFLACHGYDADPYPGERNLVVLSQPNGRYEVKAASADVGFFHSASAADLNGDGLPDVVVTNSSDPAVVYALINKGKGVFEREPRARFPASLREKGLYTVELLDVNENGNNFTNNRPDNIEHNMLLTSYNIEGRPKEFIFKNLNDLIKPGTGITIVEVDGVLTLSSTGGGGTTSDSFSPFLLMGG